ncbi:Permease of the major facilitator superfamily [Ceraceosorus bombacis]|uniref:Permease of the major facilitator superfamily n=1 Tax=Ceraceosorus bombacis TaxID=401625 RepID=A0A0P1B9J2_9BASI|nr:Permease of the major facilitator superfamily [Ceraceosorus bombacis]
MGQQIDTRPSTGKSEDGAAWASTERADDVQGTPRALLLRVDLLLVLLLFVAYGLQFWDKAVLGSATLFNLIPSLGLGGTKYGTSSGAFYWGYLVGAFPMSLAANHFKRINVWLGGCIVVWGGILLLTPAVQNFGGLVAQRFFLGFVESSVSPGFVAVTRRWYTREEQTVRLGLWYSATGVFSIVSGLTNYGLGHTRTSLPQSWMILFLVPGAFTIALGVLFALLLPPSPDTRPILAIPGYNSFSEGQRELLSKRLESEKRDPLRKYAGELDWKDEWSLREVGRAARDPKMWLFLAIATLIYVVNGSVTVFGPILVRAVFRSGGAEALALQAPGGAVTAISIYLVVFISRRYQGTRLFAGDSRPLRLGQHSKIITWADPLRSRTSPSPSSSSGHTVA